MRPNAVRDGDWLLGWHGGLRHVDLSLARTTLEVDGSVTFAAGTEEIGVDLRVSSMVDVPNDTVSALLSEETFL